MVVIAVKWKVLALVESLTKGDGFSEYLARSSARRSYWKLTMIIAMAEMNGHNLASEVEQQR